MGGDSSLNMVTHIIVVSFSIPILPSLQLCLIDIYTVMLELYILPVKLDHSVKSCVLTFCSLFSF